MISYKPFLKLLIDRNLKKQDLVNSGVLSWATMAKINKDENISLEMIDNICKYLNCQPGDILQYVPASFHDPVKINIELLSIGTIQSLIPHYFTYEDAAKFLRKHTSYKNDGSPLFNYESNEFIDFVNEQLDIACLFSDQNKYFKLTYDSNRKKYYFND